MKKLIAIAVVFALVAGVAFAVDLGGTVIGTFTPLSGVSGQDDMTASGDFNKLQLQGGGEAGEGKFGGWIRFNPAESKVTYGLKDDDDPSKGFAVKNEFDPKVAGMVWWKPIDQLKITLGGNPDGMFDKNGQAGWSFGQMIYDTGVVITQENIWGGGNIYGGKLKYRNALYRGFGDNGLILEINPIDMLGINIMIPFGSGKLDDVYRKLVAQVNLNLDFGNIAITFEGNDNYMSYTESWDGKSGDTLYAFFGLTAVENLNLDLGVGYQFDNDNGSKNPFAIALGAKYVADAFGIKLRAALLLPAEDSQKLEVLAEILPFYAISDSVKGFLAAGIGMQDDKLGFHVNPYFEIGAEWGPTFYVGFNLKAGLGSDVVSWAVPFAISVGF
jgi:hypothetical protein